MKYQKLKKINGQLITKKFKNVFTALESKLNLISNKMLKQLRKKNINFHI